MYTNADNIYNYCPSRRSMRPCGVQFMLTETTLEHVRSDWKDIPRHLLKVYRRRLRVQVVQSLIDLAFVAEREPEDQLKQMFTTKTLEPFLRAVTGEGSEEISIRHYHVAKLMLRIAHERLKPQIPPSFKMTIVPLLDQNLMLLESMEVQPRKIPPTSVEQRRGALRKQRQSIIKQLHRTQLEKNSGVEKK